MQIQIEATSEVKKSNNGSTYTAIKYGGGSWVNVWGEHSGKKGQTINITEPTKFKGNTFWAKEDKTKPEPPPQLEQPPSSSGKLTKADYKNWLRDMFSLAVELEPDSPEARAALVNTAMIALSNGKIELDEEGFPSEEE